MAAGLTLGEIVARLGGEVVGDASVAVVRVAPLERAGPGEIGFIVKDRLLDQLKSTRAAALVVGEKHRQATGLPRIVCANPYAYFARLAALLNPEIRPAPGVHPSAVVAGSARLAAGCHVGPQAVIGEDVELGAGCVVGAHCVIGDGSVLGEGCRLYPRVTIYHGCRLGRRVVLHSGVVIGADGFGIAPEDGRWLKIPQTGRVLIGDDVEIGANTTVDRGALDDTVIEDGVKLDNLIQIAHNVHVGAHTAMAACVGVAGSARIGRHCTVGGAAVILGHLEIADHVNVSAGTLITKSIRAAGTYTSAMPFEAHGRWLKNAAHLRRLDALADRVAALEAQLQASERKSS